ncbi:MAG: PspC domain-containing protein, partial [Nocardioidaceae bacterium]
MTQQHGEQGPEPDAGFDPQRLRTLTGMRRSHDDRMVAGVCSGMARHLDIDPVIIRILLVTLTFVGLAGIIVYAAVWLLVPEDGAQESIAGRTFNLGENEEQFRVVGLIIAAIIAIVSASSLIGGDAFDTPFPYLGLVGLFLLWWIVIRPYQRERRHHDRDVPADVPGTAAYTPVYGPVPPPSMAGQAAPRPGATTTMPGGPEAAPYRPPKPRNPRHDHGVLTAVTFFTAMIAVGGVWAYSLASGSDTFPVFQSLALALGVIGLGMLVGSFLGNGRPLIPLGILTAIALSVSAALPSAAIGQRTPSPSTAAQVQEEYVLGIGDMRLDLSQIADLDALDGRTVTVQEGVGSLTVIVPRGLDVDVDARTTAGQIRLFGQEHNGDRLSWQYVDPVDDGPDIRLVLEQTL